MSRRAFGLRRRFVAALALATTMGLAPMVRAAGDGDGPYDDPGVEDESEAGTQSAPSSPPNEDPAKQLARSLLLAGVGDARAGMFDAALDKFERAYALFPSPNLLINIGTSAFQVGRYAKAIDAYSRYLEQYNREPARVEELARLLPTLYRHVGGISVHVAHRDAIVRINGKQIDWLKGGWVWVDPGEYAIVAERADSRIIAKIFTIDAGERKSIKLRFSPAAEPPAPASGPSPNHLVLALAASGVAASALTVAFTSAALTLDDEAGKHCQPQAPTRCDLDGVSLGDLAHRYQRAAAVTATVGVAAFAAAFIVHSATPAAATEIALVATPVDGGGLLELRAHW